MSMFFYISQLGNEYSLHKTLPFPENSKTDLDPSPPFRSAGHFFGRPWPPRLDQELEWLTFPSPPSIVMGTVRSVQLYALTSCEK